MRPGPVAAYRVRVISYEWRGAVGNAELNALHAEAFGHEVLAEDWRGQLARHSLGWVCARDGSDGAGGDGAGGADGAHGAALVGFVNVPWDGGTHAFILDTMVARRARHRGIGAASVAVAADGARAAGCEWLHVDFTPELRGFYFGSCGFRPTDAGLIAL
jgi:GNAT superfamily N-acetyltransferase